MKIVVKRILDVPPGFYCQKNGRCAGFTFLDEDSAICSNFNTPLFRDAKSYAWLKCHECMDRTLSYLETRTEHQI